MGDENLPLSGKDMLRIYLRAGWRILRQRGSHVIVGKGTRRESIPLHRELKRGLERALLKRLLDSAADEDGVTH